MRCSSNNTCPETYFCLNKICAKDIKCVANNDCADDEQCIESINSIPMCVKVCENRPCGRNADCSATSHKFVCSCKEGFIGDPIQGCRKKECNFDQDCSEDKMCTNNICTDTCTVKNYCGENSICSSENHKGICYCQAGFTGDPLKRCIEIDWCKTINCGPGAECVNTKTEARCSCPPGTVANQNKDGCRKASECRFNRDCPGSARCAVTDGIRKCTGIFTLTNQKINICYLYKVSFIFN